MNRSTYCASVKDTTAMVRVTVHACVLILVIHYTSFVSWLLVVLAWGIGV